MKRLFIPVFLILGLHVQAADLITGAKPSPVNDPSVYTIKSRDANSRTWQWTEIETQPDGRQIPRLHSYTELASGLNVLNPQTGQYSDADDSFVITSDGYAVARHTQHQLIVSPSLGDGDGNVDLRTPDGRRLRSSIIALNLFNRASGDSLLIAEVSPDAVGHLVAPNEIVFRNAFTGFGADVRILNGKGEIHQDVLLNEALDLKELEAAGFPADVSTLEIWTEYLEAPQPSITSRMVQQEASALKRAAMVEPDVVSDDLDFGIMKMPSGLAYLSGGEPTPDPSQEGKQRGQEINVSKRWMTISNRRFVVESIPLGDTKAMFAQMPVNRLSPGRLQAGTRNIRREPPVPRMARKQGQTIQMAKLAFPSSEESGVGSARTMQLVWDPVTLNGSLTNRIFQGDTTYYLSGNVSLYGTNTVFEGGCVLKYASNVALTVNTPVTWLADNYRPVAMSCKDDDSLGESISGSTGSPTGYYANPALGFTTGSPVLSHFRIAYAKQGLVTQSGTLTASDGQFVKCQNGAKVTYGNGYFRNVLFSNVRTNFNDVNYVGISVQNATFDTSAYLMTPVSGTMSLTVNNSILANVTNLSSIYLQPGGSYNGFYSSPAFGTSQFSTTSYPFQSVGGGNYYLTNGCSFRNVGTTNVDSTLLASLRKKTTYPPIVYSNATISVPTTLGPQAQRDTDIPDLGYHYDPLDYAFGGSHASNTLTFAAGTAVGWWHNSSGWQHAGQGIQIADRQLLTFDGTAESPCYWVRTHTVQEQGGTGTWQGGYGPGGITSWNDHNGPYTNAPTVFARFLICSGMALWDNHFRDDYSILIGRFRDCEFYSGGVGGYNSSYYFTNCLFYRQNFGSPNEGRAGNELVARNCTLYGGYVYISPDIGIPISIRDCAFEGTNFTFSAYASNTNYADYDYNAYTNAANPFPLGGSHDKSSVVFNWQTGPLGNFYLPTNSVLINAGDVTADVPGLYHFTTQTNEIREAATQVDIGYHYLATACGAIDTVWVDDAVPAGATQAGDGGDSWTWVSSNPGPFSKLLASQSNISGYEHQHYFYNATANMTVNSGDKLIAFVYLDPANTPSEVMLQWNDGSWEHRAYWGANNIAWGVNGTSSRRYMGALPASGQWVRLEVPANLVGLEGYTLNGMAFTLYGGRATWDCAGKNGGLLCYDTDGDGLADYFEDSNGNGIYDAGDVCDFTNTDTDGDHLPDGWELQNFGNFGQGEHDDYDDDGYSNLQEFLEGTDPNSILFSTHYDNLYVSNRTVAGSCEVTAGVPYQLAVLVNSTNLAVANWVSYSSNFTATLPNTDGVYTVTVALRGRTTNFPPVWDETEFTLDRVPPVLIITNPAGSIVIKPYLQLQGYASEPLAVLSYDLTNAAGSLTNEPAFVVDQFFDTNRFDFTSNYFQAYDVELTNDVNTITLRATDLAGNVTTTNISVTLNYTTATNPPVMQLLWPTNGAHLSGDSFYLRGLINDETANVTAQLVDANGTTNEITGVVERNGIFWVEDLPLADGTNKVTLVALDAAGNLSSTNLSMVKGSVTLNITYTPEAESLYTPYGEVYGTVSDTNYSVSVNGVTATVYESGFWMAANVPVLGMGTATFDAVATATGGGGGGGGSVSTSVTVEMPAVIQIVKHSTTKTTRYTDGASQTTATKRVKEYNADYQESDSGNWVAKNVRGAVTDDYQNANFSSQTEYVWTHTNRTTHYTDNTPYESSSTNFTESYGSITGVPDTDESEEGWVGGPGGEGAYPPIFVSHYFAKGVKHAWSYPDGGSANANVNARTQMKLYTGGKAGVSRKSLIHINAYAQEYRKPTDFPWMHTPTTNVVATKIKVLGWWLFGRYLDASGDLYITLPDNTVKDLNLRVPGVKHYGAWAEATRHKLMHETAYPAWADSNPARTSLGVGEYVECWFEPGNFPTNAVWTASAGGFDTDVGNWVWYTAPSNAASATVTVRVANADPLKIKFKVKEPSGVILADIIETNHYPIGQTGAGMHLRPFLGPLDVSFYRVQIMEVGEDATSVTGWFTNVPTGDLSHINHGADAPIPITEDNAWDSNWDWTVESGPGFPVGYGGGYTWNIPARWWIGNGPTNSMTGWNQVISMDSSGAITIEKFERSVNRTANDVITTH